MSRCVCAIPTIVASVAAMAANAQWVNYVNESATRVSAASGLGLSDVEEKDYAWADLDQDGWTDLVVVRKQPFTTPGKKANVLFMNENGVLTDRTALYASASDVGGDQGFLTVTNDRDVVIGDVTGDGWLDVITATTISDGDPKHIGHPRVYRNLGNDAGGNWLGLRFENGRIPQLQSINGINQNPRFCSVAVGDVTGDGYADLYFGDYDSSGAGGSGESGGDNYDMDNRLLINQGAANPGFFTDQSTMRMGPYNGQMLNSAFGAASIIIDVNGDGRKDVVKQTSLQSPTEVAVVYNSPTIGFFNGYDVVNSNSPYFVSPADLNNDGKVDLIVTDDFVDRYYLNTGNGADTFANFTPFTLPSGGGASGTDGFGSQSVAADLNDDGYQDILIADVDVDIGPCGSRTADIIRSNANPPNVTFAQDYGNLPSSQFNGVHNLAVFDLDNDGDLDIVSGKCTGTQVWINQLYQPEPPTTTQVVPITVITNQIGTFSGTTANVAASDNAYVLVNPTLNGNSTRWQTDHWFECNSPVADIIQLDVKTEVGENVNTIKTTKLYIYNWDLLMWTQLTSYGQPAADTIKIFTNIANPDAYVKDNNGKIRVRIRTQEDFANQPTGYQGRVDHVEVKVTY